MEFKAPSFFFILLGLFFCSSFISQVSSRDCLASDITATYTKCSNNLRNLIWYYKENANCTGGVPLPPNKFGLPCDIACGEGEYLPFGELNCALCDPGSYSVGGGIRQLDWNANTFPNYLDTFHYKTYCTYNRGTVPVVIPCPDGWNYVPGGNVLFSGSNMTDYQSAYLELSILLITQGHIHFSYRVDAEAGYDGLTFYVNNVLQMPLALPTSEFQDFQLNLTAGYYTFLWVYSKDFSISQGDDGTYIKMIEIGGISMADNYCTPCPNGTFAPNSGQEQCGPCPPNTYSQKGASTCLPCSDDTFALPGSSTCLPRGPCTPADYLVKYTPCSAPGQRIKFYNWVQPIYCNTSSLALPPNQTVPCDTCNPGTSRNISTGDYSCVSCPTGYYSSGANDTCHPCGQGSQAMKGLFYTYFDTIPPNFQTGCDGVCASSGWRFMGNFTDSGVGHGVVNSWLKIDVDLEVAGFISFQYFLSGTCYLCDLEVIDQGYSTNTFFLGSPSIGQVPLVAGHHSILMNFHKMDTSSLYASSTVVITQINITGVTNGGAAECTNCLPGYISSGLVSYCSVCPAGTTNNSLATSCEPCPANTFNDRIGFACIPCGSGTWSSPGSTGCETNCKYMYDSNTVYDLTPLNSSIMYGPIFARQHTFYLNICQRETTNRTCFNELGESTYSYACQIYPGNGWSYDIGRVLSYNPYLPNPRSGIELGYTYGTSIGGCPVPRSTNLTLICDPSAGIGQLKPKDPVESPLCHYRFEWSSLYACPLCSSFDYTYQYSECIGGFQTKTYFWKDDPKRCRDGVSLPPQETNIPCVINTIKCPAGQYLPPGTSTCQNCTAGYFSVGGGIEFGSWQTLPSAFTTSCQGSGCTGWQTNGYSVYSGNGNSLLTLVQSYVVEGLITFSFKFLSSVSGASFNFYVDNQIAYSFASLELQYRTVTILNISSSLHKFTWEFINPLSNSFNLPVHVEIKSIRIVGTSYADSSCFSCYPGTYSNNGASFCTPCPAGTQSYAVSSSCSPCLSRQYSFQGAENCFSRPDCTNDFVQILYTPCNNNRRVAYPVLIDPPCAFTDTFSLPFNRTVSCAPCLPGTYLNTATGRCQTCSSSNLYYDSVSNQCLTSNPGSFIKRQQLFFFDNSANTLPPGWTTGCSGGCGTPGWRVRGTYIDSGFQNIYTNYDSDSYLVGFANLVVDGSVAFIVTIPSVGRFDFFINGTPIYYDYRPGDNQVDIPLSAGRYIFIWNYHQSTERNVTQVRQILIKGTDTGIAYLEDCPAGTYSGSSGSQACTACSAGTYSNSPQSTQCLNCSTNQFQPNANSVSCFDCGQGSFSFEGSRFCSTTCVFEVSDNNGKTYTYDLSQIPSKVGPITVGTSDYYLSLCGVLRDSSCLDAQGNFVETSVCVVNTSTGVAVDHGNSLEFFSNSLFDIDQGFLLQYSFGSMNGCSTYRKASITFVCDTTKIGTPQIYPATSECDSINILWHSSAGCPVCQVSDYNEVIEQCNNGQQDVVYVKQTQCVGRPASLVDRVQSCSASPVPIIVSVIVSVVIVALVVIVVVLVIRNRRTQMAYKILQDEWNSKIELQTQ